jgi:hypothetical protein
VVDAVAPAECTLVEQAGEVLGDGGVAGGGAGVLEDVKSIRAPSVSTDFRLEDAFPFGEVAFVDRKFEVFRFGNGVE